MCGRYFWTDDAEDAFDEDFPDLAGAVRRLRTGDYTPGMSALAIAAGDSAGVAGAAGVAESAESAGGVENARSGSRVRMEPLLWGFPGFDKGRLLINALRTALPGGAARCRQRASTNGTKRRKR